MEKLLNFRKSKRYGNRVYYYEELRKISKSCRGSVTRNGMNWNFLKTYQQYGLINHGNDINNHRCGGKRKNTISKNLDIKNGDDKYCYFNTEFNIGCRYSNLCESYNRYSKREKLTVPVLFLNDFKMIKETTNWKYGYNRHPNSERELEIKVPKKYKQEIIDSVKFIILFEPRSSMNNIWKRRKKKLIETLLQKYPTANIILLISHKDSANIYPPSYKKWNYSSMFALYSILSFKNYERRKNNGTT